MRILFVCLGNICRSPTAEILCRHAIEEGELPSDWQARSAGTLQKSGRPMHPDVRRLLNEHGMNPPEHRSREVSKQLIADADLVLTMEAHQAESLQAAFPELAERIHMLSELAGERTDVEDPYMEPGVTFRETFEQIQSYLDGCEDAMRSLTNRNVKKPNED